MNSTNSASRIHQVRAGRGAASIYSPHHVESHSALRDQELTSFGHDRRSERLWKVSHVARAPVGHDAVEEDECAGIQHRQGEYKIVREGTTSSERVKHHQGEYNIVREDKTSSGRVKHRQGGYNIVRVGTTSSGWVFAAEASHERGGLI